MENFASIMEMLMIICFGISWPINIRKAWKSRSTKGISPFFYSLILAGYIFGIIGKIYLIVTNAPTPWYETVKWYVLLFYFINSIMVASGILIYFRNRRIEKREKQSEN